MKKRKILDLLVSVGSFSNFISEIVRLSEIELSSYVCVCNVHMLIEAKKGQSFRGILNNANITLPDGMPVAKVLSWKNNFIQERVSGMDMLPQLIDECARRSKTIYFYGSTKEVLHAIENRIILNHPSLKIKMYSPPFRKLSSKENRNIVEGINEFNPDFVFVALGCPKQEKWMAEQKGIINSCMIGFGGAFPVYAGLQKRAPNWMRIISLEWVYRLLSEPRRLFTRYFITNSFFIYYVCLDLINHQKSK